MTYRGKSPPFDFNGNPHCPRFSLSPLNFQKRETPFLGLCLLRPRLAVGNHHYRSSLDLSTTITTTITTVHKTLKPPICSLLSALCMGKPLHTRVFLVSGETQMSQGSEFGFGVLTRVLGVVRMRSYRSSSTGNSSVFAPREEKLE